ncbi:Deoxyribonuclease-2-alpha [Trichinella papuae]|uniref:Deoxyribonuclease-2-alpha n=1 Tax=Trichinella papuae TaxID=268474 RepID=A0A0V1N0G2_9BILA|nr:Deoxyribonuclease-2-alpha [Trichinella papuae]
MEQETQIGPTQANGKVLLSTAPGNWANGAAALTAAAGHSFAVSLTGVVANAANIKFLAYNNVPPAVPNVQTKSNSKGVIIVSIAGGANEGRWIVHTVPGFPAAKTGYSWPAAETAKGHLLICMTIAETQINAIASSLIRAEPFVYYNDIPESETAGMRDFKKLAEGQTATMPPFTIKQSIKIAAVAPIDVHIYSKSAKSRYEIYKKVLSRSLKKTIKVWSRRDNKLKGDCRVLQRNIRLIKSPAQIGDHATNIEADQSNWIVSEPGNIFCFTDKPYAKSQATEPAMAVCIDQAAIFARFDAIAAQVENCPQVILYKGPAQNTGKLLASDVPGNWADGARDVTQAAGHSFAVILTDVVGNHANVKFLAYNNVPPGIQNVKTKSNGKAGVIMISTAGGVNDGAWIVHTVPGFPAAKTGYSWPAAEIAKGHLLICMTIAETQINAIAASLFRAEPFIYYNDIPESETAGMPDFKKLAEGQIPTMPPFTISRSIKLTGAGAVPVQIYSKSAKSRYEIYKKVILRRLKKTIKVWSRRDNKLKGDCRIPQRNIRLIKSPVQIAGHATNIETDESNWIISEPGNIFCFMDKPYARQNLRWQFVLTKLQFLLALILLLLKAILYKGPTQDRGKFLASDAPDNWVDGAAAVTARAGHSFAVALNDVVGNHANIKFLAYNNVPPGIQNVKTKSNGKAGVIMISTAGGVNDGAWIVHTVPGFPAAKTGYNWPAAEIAKGHLLICMTIAETQINAIAASLFRAEPFIYYNDIPESETAGMPDFKKLAEGQIPTMPPFTISRSIKLTGAGAVPVQIYSKSAKSRYEIYKKVILRRLKKTIKVWSRRDNKLKGDCRIPQRNIRLIKSPVQIAGHATNIETDESNWIISEPGNIFCFMDKPYAKSQATEPALAVCFDQAAIFARFNTIAAQNNGKLLASDSPDAWADGAAVVTQNNGHSFAVALTDVVGNHANVKFLAYNNIPPAIPNVKTKSNSKGVIIVNSDVVANDGAWIVHTVPGFPAAKTGYSWPAAEIAKGHLLICMTIAETQINAIAASLIRAEPFVYYNDIPESVTAGMPDFKKLAEGQITTKPPFTISRSIKLTGAGAVPVQIYSKSAKSRYEFYKKVILKALKKTIKVWSRRDNKLKGDCRIPQRNIRLIKSPAQIAGHATNIEADVSNWIISEPGNIFCFTDKPYAVTILKRQNLRWQSVLTKLQFLLDLILLLLKAILYKGPAQNTGKLLASDSPGAWVDNAAVVTANAGHSFAVALTHVVGNHANVKFLAYNNVPPGIPNVKTKSSSKGVIIISTAAGQNDGAWIVHTVPGFPAAKTGYSWPAAEIAKGHLLICMTIAETQINAIAASLIQTEPFVYYNDIPETETAGMPDFKKLADGQIPVSPPFTTRRSIKTAAAAAVDVHIYSKSAKSKYEIYKKVIVKALKKTIKVWSRRDNKLKGDCRVLQRNIRLIKSPAQIGDHATNIETDESNWIVSEPGNIFCFTDKPYSNLGWQFVLTKMQFLLDLMLLLLKLKTVHNEKNYLSK